VPKESNQEKDQQTDIAVIKNDISYMKSIQQAQNIQLNTIETKVGSHYVTKEEFAPIKNLVYGLVGLILIAVMGGLMSLVLRK
jgi:hypothetical protein